jgi:hypothetical protein
MMGRINMRSLVIFCLFTLVTVASAMRMPMEFLKFENEMKPLNSRPKRVLESNLYEIRRFEKHQIHYHQDHIFLPWA